MATKKKPAEPAREPLTVNDFQIETVDNARAIITLGSEKTGLLTQADLHRLGKEIARAVQSTY